jgi:hypothetical protein
MSLETYTEDDLRAAIGELAEQAPNVVTLREPRPQRNRARVRILAPVAAALAVLVVAGVLVFTRHNHSGTNQPAGPGPTAAHPCRSASTPQFVTFGESGDSKIGIATTCAGYRSQTVEIGTTQARQTTDATVTLFAPGVFDPGELHNRRSVQGNGISGYAGTLTGDPTGQCPQDSQGESVPQNPCATTAVAWQYAANVWGLITAPHATVQTLLQGAANVSEAADPLRFPVRFGYVPPGLHASAAIDAGFDPPQGITLLYHSGAISFDRGTETALNATVKELGAVSQAERSQPDTPTSVSLERGNCFLTLSTLNSRVPHSELEKMLRSATFSDCTKPTTWPTANQAVGG